jgi:hypothetical protein
VQKRLLADTRPLANPHFKRLWRANIVTVIGAQLTVVAVPAQIYAMTGSSAYVGLTGAGGLSSARAALLALEPADPGPAPPHVRWSTVAG